MAEEAKRVAWQDPFPMDQPLDIRHVSNHIERGFMLLMESILSRHQSETRQAISLGFTLPHPRLSIGEHQQVGKLVIDALRAYDEGRTQHIAFLRSELIRLHEIGLPPIIVQMPPKEPKP